MSGVRRTNEPHDRLTHLCDEMVQPLNRDENADVKAVVMLQDGDKGGIVMHGYEDATEGMTDLFIHLGAIFESQGKQLMLLNEDGINMLSGDT